MILIRRIYTLYVFLVFCIGFLLVFPLLLIFIWVPGLKKFGRKINRIWAKTFFVLIFMRVELEGKKNIEKDKNYVFVANHFSYLDIAMMGLVPGDVVFIGKSSIRKIPLFGYYFRKLHIAVNRTSPRSRGEVLVRAKKSIDQGSSLVIFPEGGITTTNPPQMNRFKDGAFSLAIDKQIPIIPVTLSFNHLILPDDGRFLFNLRTAKMVFHKPILTEGKTSKDVASLRETCFEIIQQQLWEDNTVLSPDNQSLNTL
ncbi:hypothetical protein P872_18075 [Rhodonellum psychrophilum GCM71 = DSM 17998]|uniref:Phospholipid/glycerol acyltransferase domain-containing protein n=3 Tax=Cytophagaceae TaxID=89373 RepID=U5BPD5_9BACT|nr:lysophospholipid acyltransferase family protein [Rhodonellum ikkaensis]ERM82420.1 hypothetical protein P872_18075 [Rhodonellum psychrophilum GCM71 = DSM 17998]SDY88319.1 1-acyl-sn-glycerol-3-phosphate acyltransferase [Rhodonellum ikkaensis]